MLPWVMMLEFQSPPASRILPWVSRQCITVLQVMAMSPLGIMRCTVVQPECPVILLWVTVLYLITIIPIMLLLVYRPLETALEQGMWQLELMHLSRTLAEFGIQPLAIIRCSVPRVDFIILPSGCIHCIPAKAIITLPLVIVLVLMKLEETVSILMGWTGHQKQPERPTP